ncbi:MAG: PQQ-dependent sugar dehydrogenase [Salinibacterium sp.]|nr:MAG: PQQ-dependent sugar dehydrogenase [Salinibacterium sp.]
MRIPVAVAATLIVALVSGCAPVTEPPTPSPTGSTPIPVEPTGTPNVVAIGLNAPWSMVRLPSGSTLVSERNTAQVMELQADHELRVVGHVPNVVPGGEGGLLGIEYVNPKGATGPWVYTYFTTATDNRVLRFRLLGHSGTYSLGAGREIITGLPKAQNHDGGRIKVGPDGMLYVTVGDATERELAQDPDRLNGKILRLRLDGSIPRDNPTHGSPVYSLGHRNPEGIAWDEDGNLWESELGQDTWDELNLIKPGGNYGWPIVEGKSDNATFINPVYQWHPADASPSGLAFTRDTLFLATLRGTRLWTIHPGEPATAEDWFVGEYGRMRDVIPGPHGTVWILTNNTDGRGNPIQGDDRIIQIKLAPVQ